MLNRFFETRFIEPLVYGKHSRILNRMRSMGYEVNGRGMCYGIAHMGVQAILAEDVKLFSDRLTLLDSHTPYDHTKIMNDEKQKRILLLQIAQDDAKKSKETPCDAAKISKQVQAHLSKEEKIFLEMPAFFDGIVTLSESCFYPDLFPTLTSLQDAESVFRLIKSHKIAETGDIINVGAHSGAYSTDEMNEYFFMIKQELRKEPALNRLAITLNNSKHIITISYDYKTDKWIFIDANQLPVKYFSSCSELCSHINKAFGCRDMSVFETTFYTQEPYALLLKHKLIHLKGLPRFKEIHTVQKNKASFKDLMGGTWLNCAAYAGELSVIEQLLHNNADLFHSDALNLAVAHNHLAIAEYLLNFTPSKLKSSLVSATLLNNGAMIELLLKHKKNGHYSLEDHTSALMVACLQNRMNLIEQLIKDHPDINMASINGNIPLIVACEYGGIDIVRYLLTHGADPHIFDKQGTTPLVAAAIHGSLDIIEELFKHNVSINQTFQANSEELLKKVKNTDKNESINALLGKNYKLMIPSHIPGMTALHMAAFYGHNKVVKKLLEKGADMNLTSSNGISVFEIAKAMGHRDIVITLECEIYKSKITFAEPYRATAIKTLLQNVQESKSLENSEKDLSAFKSMDHFAQELLTIMNHYKADNLERVKSLNALQNAVFQAYKDYANHVDANTIIETLKTTADNIASQIKKDHESSSLLFKMYGKKSELESNIIAITHSVDVKPMLKLV